MSESKELELPRATGVGRPEETRFNLAIYGASGGGKTALVEEIILAKKKRLLIIDSLCKDYGNPDFCKATGISYDAVITDYTQFHSTLVKLIGKDGKGNFRLVVRCPKKEMDVMNLFVYDDSKKRATITDCTVVVEEIPLFMSSNSMPEQLIDVIARGRHSRINLVGVAQVPTKQTNPLYRSQMDVFLSFRQTEKNAIDFFSEFDAEKAERLKDLKRGEYLLFKGEPQQLLDFIEQP